MDPEAKKIPTIEMFGPTIQGEGSVIGQLTYFIRFGGCDYRCKLCDSMHAVDPKSVHENATWVAQEGIALRLSQMCLKSPFVNWVTFSGGNPAIHDLTHLIHLLRMQEPSWNIAVETQGSIYQEWFHKVDVLTLSPKSPGMGERFDADIFFKLLAQVRHHEGLCIKIVAFSQEDLNFARGVFSEARDYGITMEQCYISQGNPYPNLELEAYDIYPRLRTRYLELFDLIQRDPFLARAKFLPQLHTWLWGNQKGV